MKKDDGKTDLVPAELRAKMGMFTPEEGDDLAVIPGNAVPVGELDVPAEMIRFNNEGEFLVGIYMGRKFAEFEKDGEEQEAFLYTFDCTSDPKVPTFFKFWGSTKLDEKMATAPRGAILQITYSGKEDIGNGRSMNNFNVFFIGSQAQLSKLQAEQNISEVKGKGGDAPL